jgi:hypothetical protein
MRQRKLERWLIWLAWIIFIFSLPLPSQEDKNIFTVRLPVAAELLLLVFAALRRHESKAILLLLQPIAFIITPSVLSAARRPATLWAIRGASFILLAPVAFDVYAQIRPRPHSTVSLQWGFHVYALSQAVMFLACWSGWQVGEIASSKRGFTVLPAPKKVSDDAPFLSNDD